VVQIKIFKNSFGGIGPFLGFFSILWIVGFLAFLKVNEGTDLIFFNTWRGSFWDNFFIYGTMLGEEHVYAFFTIVLFFKNRRDAIWVPVIGFSVMLISYLLKFLFSHPRPGAFANESWYRDSLILVEGVVPYSAMTSFPSGHTMSAFALAIGLVYLFKLNRVLWIFPFLGAVIVGISRVYLVQHFLKDVLAGSLIGILVGLTIIWLHKRYWSVSPGPAESSS
jgi:membrane-associated phospholipid phosphatase